MDTFFESAKNICNNILPILGVIALIMLIVLLIELIKTIKSANKALIKSNGTLDQLNDSITKVQAPLDAAVKVSKSVDKAHDATIKGLGDAKDYVVKNASVIKEKVTTLLNKEEEDYDEFKEPSPEDIIGGK